MFCRPNSLVQYMYIYFVNKNLLNCFLNSLITCLICITNIDPSFYSSFLKKKTDSVIFKGIGFRQWLHTHCRVTGQVGIVVSAVNGR